MEHERLECWCNTCNTYLTLEDIREDVHAGHQFSPADSSAIAAVREYLNRRQRRA